MLSVHSSFGTSHRGGHDANASSKGESRLCRAFSVVSHIDIFSLRRMDPLPLDSFFPKDISPWRTIAIHSFHRILLSLLQSIFHYDPSKRPTTDELLAQVSRICSVFNQTSSSPFPNETLWHGRLVHVVQLHAWQMDKYGLTVGWVWWTVFDGFLPNVHGEVARYVFRGRGA